MAAQRKRRTRKRSVSRTRKQDYPGWLWMLFGLSIGLSVAFAIYVKDRHPDGSPTFAQKDAADNLAVDNNGEVESTAEMETPKKSRFDFYEMLPNFEVIIPEQEPDVAADVEPRAVVDPGIYVLQAGSFTSYADADRRRAELALQGIESNIQRVTIDDKTYHRVRIGPIDDLRELNILRSRLRAARIDVLRIRLGD
ncbi:MAG: SPOR domain-containing protein [Proteobacteria bacterium]|nr:SPOR domain-containing protein [Pseudomonadota bacterium]MCH7834183.1 SPOR domain-containing protein [Pseudomonadota bacterium]